MIKFHQNPIHSNRDISLKSRTDKQTHIVWKSHSYQDCNNKEDKTEVQEWIRHEFVNVILPHHLDAFARILHVYCLYLNLSQKSDKTLIMASKGE